MPYAYSVAIKLSVANLASQGIRLIAKDMLAAHGAAVNLQTKLSALKLAAVGFGLQRAGLGIFHGLEKTVDASKEYTAQIALMNAAGLSHLEIAQSVGAAWVTSHEVLTSTAASNLRQLRELRSLFGDQHMAEAYAVLPTVSRTQAIMHALTGRRSENIGFEMAKVAELRQSGVMTLPYLQRNLDQLSRTLYAMGGTITASDYLMTMKYAKTAALSFSDQFVYRELPTLIQEVKSAGGGLMGNASQAGTALMTLYSSIVQGKMPKSSIPIWLATGLIKPSDIIRNATGHWQIRPGGVEGAQLFQQDPFEWAQMVAPQLKRYATAHHLNMLQLISTMFSARNSQWMMNTLIAKAAQIERDSALIGHTPGNLAIYRSLLKTNPMLAEEALHAQWQNVLSIMGYQVLPRILPLMVSFANDLNSLAGWMQKHAKITSGIVISLGALSASLVTLGNIMMGRALIRFLGLGPMLGSMFSGAWALIANPIGLTIAAIAAIGVGAYELWKHWDVVWPKIKSIWHDMATGAVWAWGNVKTSFGELAGWISKEWDHLTHWFHHGSPAAAPAAATPPGVGASSSSHVVTRGPATTVVHSHVYVDGKKVAQATTRHLTKALGAPQTGSSFFDGRSALVPAGGVQDY